MQRKCMGCGQQEQNLAAGMQDSGKDTQGIGEAAKRIRYALDLLGNAKATGR